MTSLNGVSHSIELAVLLELTHVLHHRRVGIRTHRLPPPVPVAAG
jgi:hypothetical protein